MPVIFFYLITHFVLFNVFFLHARQPLYRPDYMKSLQYLQKKQIKAILNMNRPTHQDDWYSFECTTKKHIIYENVNVLDVLWNNLTPVWLIFPDVSNNSKINKNGDICLCMNISYFNFQNLLADFSKHFELWTYTTQASLLIFRPTKEEWKMIYACWGRKCIFNFSKRLLQWLTLMYVSFLVNALKHAKPLVWSSKYKIILCKCLYP